MGIVLNKGMKITLMEEMRDAYIKLSGEYERKRPIGRPKRRWKNNIKIHLKEMGYEGVDWTILAQDRVQWRDLVSSIMNLRVS
jgi:hypothetical protein